MPLATTAKYYKDLKRTVTQHGLPLYTEGLFTGLPAGMAGAGVALSQPTPEISELSGKPDKSITQYMPGMSHYQAARKRLAFERLVDPLSEAPTHEFIGKGVDTLVGAGIGMAGGKMLGDYMGWKNKWLPVAVGGAVGILPNLVGTTIGLIKSRKTVQEHRDIAGSKFNTIAMYALPGYSAYRWASSLKTADTMTPKEIAAAKASVPVRQDQGIIDQLTSTATGLTSDINKAIFNVEPRK